MTRDGGFSRRTFVKLAAGSTAATLLAGCSSDDGDDGGDVDPDDWEDVDEIRLTGHTTDGWTGIEPEVIDGVSNPTLLLFEGREYDLAWENEDGVTHNLELRDDGESTLEETEYVGDQGETTSITFEATEEMVTYVCNPHPNDMAGRIEVHSE